MSERPYQPFYKPYGMTDEEYEYEKRIAAEKLAEWEQEQNESNLLDAQVKPANGGLSDETLKDLGFIKIPDAMYYERGWEHKEINIAFDKRPTEIEFWTFIANEFGKRGRSGMAQEIKHILQF